MIPIPVPKGLCLLEMFESTHSYFKSGVTARSTGYLDCQGKIMQLSTSSPSFLADDTSARILCAGRLLHVVLPSFLAGKTSKCAGEKGQPWLENFCIKKRVFYFHEYRWDSFFQAFLIEMVIA